MSPNCIKFPFFRASAGKLYEQEPNNACVSVPNDAGAVWSNYPPLAFSQSKYDVVTGHRDTAQDDTSTISQR